MTMSQQLWQTLTRIRRTLGVGPKQMSALMLLTREEYCKLAQEQKDLPARCTLQLCRALNISFEMLMTESFCYRALARQFYGDRTAIPEKYTLAGKSKRRVLANLLDYVEVASDWQRRLELMRHLQINESALADPDGTVNLRCTVEAIEWLHRQSKNDESLQLLGQKIMLGAQSPGTIGELQQCRSIYDLFDAICYEKGLSYRHFEKNILWKIDKVFRGEKIIIRGYLNEEVHEQIGGRYIKSRPTSAVRAAMMSVAPQILGWGRVPTEMVDPFLRDDNTCCMEVDISLFVRAHAKSRLTLVH